MLSLAIKLVYRIPMAQATHSLERQPVKPLRQALATLFSGILPGYQIQTAEAIRSSATAPEP